MVNYLPSQPITTTLSTYIVQLCLFQSLTSSSSGAAISCTSNTKFTIASCYFLLCSSSVNANVLLTGCNTISINCSYFDRCSAGNRYASFHCQSSSTILSDYSVFACKCVSSFDISYGEGYSSFSRVNYSYNTCPSKGTSAIVTRGNGNYITYGHFVNSESYNELVVAFENCQITMALSNFINNTCTNHYGGTIWLYYADSQFSDIIVSQITHQYPIYITSSTTSFTKCSFQNYAGSLPGITPNANPTTILQTRFQCEIEPTRNYISIQNRLLMPVFVLIEF